MVHWLGLGTFPAVSLSSIPGQGINIPQAGRCSQKKKKKEKCRPCRVIPCPLSGLLSSHHPLTLSVSATLGSLLFLEHQAHSCLRTFAPAVASAWGTSRHHRDLPLTSVPFLWPLLGCLTNRLVSNEVTLAQIPSSPHFLSCSQQQMAQIAYFPFIVGLFASSY